MQHSKHGVAVLELGDAQERSRRETRCQEGHVERRSYHQNLTFHNAGAAAAGKKYGGIRKKKPVMCLLFEILRQGVKALSNGEWKYMYDRPSQSRVEWRYANLTRPCHETMRHETSLRVSAHGGIGMWGAHLMLEGWERHHVHLRSRGNGWTLCCDSRQL
jgi:hypothetical protein